MRTTQLIKLEALIGERKRTIKRGDAAILKRIPNEVITFKAIEALDRMVSNGNGDPFMPLAALSCLIGKNILQGIENPEDTIKKINSRRFRVGSYIVNVLGEYNVLKLANNRKNRESHALTIDNEELFFKLILSIPVNLERDAVETRPHFSPPEPFKSIRHTSGADLVRRCNRKARKAFKRAAMAPVFDAINRQMQTGYKVNTELLNIFNELGYEDVSNLKGKNFDEVQTVSVQYDTRRTLDIANQIGDRTFWMMMYYDFRGRLYGSSVYMNNQASKLSKSLFLLDEAKPVDEKALEWIKIHAVNCWGEDKLPLADRVKFFDDNKDKWMEWADMPLELTEWRSADDPYSFLAALLELKGYFGTPEGETYLSGLPIALDMTCSGLQILSMMSKDEKSAVLCNLLAGADRGDYYLFIADNIDLFNTHPFWHKVRDKRRSVVKRSCMTYFYHCGAKTMGNHIWNDFRSEKGFEGLKREYCDELGKEVYAKCRELMAGPTRLMDRFIEAGLEFHSKKQDLTYNTPDGFLVMQDYRRNQTTMFDAIFNKKRMGIRVVVQRDKTIDYHKVKSASPANVTHSFDAFLLRSVINYGYYNKMVIHDSFSSVPADAQSLYEDVRTVSIDAFGGDLLKECLGVEDIKYGNLDITQLADNEYYAS